MLTSFEEKYHKKGAMISAVDLLKGIAVGAGLDNIIVEGANGGLHTNYTGKAEAAVDALAAQDYDFVYVHIEAPDEMGHQGSIPDKIKAIENIDQKIIGPIVGELEDLCMDFRTLVLPDHPTPICVRTHTGNPVPYLYMIPERKQKECRSIQKDWAIRAHCSRKKDTGCFPVFLRWTMNGKQRGRKNADSKEVWRQFGRR